MKKILEKIQLDILYFVLRHTRSKLLAPTEGGPPELTIHLLLHMDPSGKERAPESNIRKAGETAHLF